MNKEQQKDFLKMIHSHGLSQAIDLLPYDALDKPTQDIVDSYINARTQLLELITNEAIEEMEPLSQL